MPLDFRPFDVLLAGLDQKTSALTKAPGKLERAVNVVVDKAGKLSKRRGYQFIDPADIVNRTTDVDAVMMHIATHHDELVVFTYDGVIALGDKDSQLESTTGDMAFVWRGPNNRGNAKLRQISTSRLAQGSDGDLP